MRIGTGWDIHRLVKDRALVLGGVTIPHQLGESGHSDGDVVIHAIIDALLGAASQGDIGTHFPSSDPQWKDISSLELLAKTLELLKRYVILHIDCTIILEKPKLQQYISTIRVSLSEACQIPLEQISVKAKTAEGLLGEVGEGTAVIAQASVLMDDSEETDTIGIDPWL